MLAPPERKGGHRNIGTAQEDRHVKAPDIYRSHRLRSSDLKSSDIAAAVIAERYRLQPHIARVIVELAGLAGRFV